jgi:hypothetical protein
MSSSAALSSREKSTPTYQHACIVIKAFLVRSFVSANFLFTEFYLDEIVENRIQAAAKVSKVVEDSPLMQRF